MSIASWLNKRAFSDERDPVLKPASLRSILRTFTLTVLVVVLIVWKLFYTPFFMEITCSYDLANRPLLSHYKTTRFEFRYGATTRIVHDPRNQLRYVYGNWPDEISISPEGKRLIVFNSPQVIIKSIADSVEVEEDDVRLQGWLGSSSDETEFTVDSKGEIYSSREAYILEYQ